LLRLPSDNYERYKLDENAHVADFNAERYENDSKGFPALPGIWEAVVAVPVFNNGELKELRLHPISLGYGLPVQVRGRPVLAEDALSRKIIDNVSMLSEPFGTKIDYRNGVGYVRIK